jgi:catechol-2,3-dioxygenase
MATSDSTQTNRRIDELVTIGHVHLKVSDLERSLSFYCGVLGFELMQRSGTEAAFISAGGYHHHIGLNTWESLGGSPPSPGTTDPAIRSFELLDCLRVFVSENDDAFTLRQTRQDKLHAIAERARVAGIRMKNVFRPMLRGQSVVAEWSDNLEFECPLSRNQNVKESLCSRCRK